MKYVCEYTYNLCTETSDVYKENEKGGQEWAEDEWCA